MKISWAWRRFRQFETFCFLVCNCFFATRLFILKARCTLIYCLFSLFDFFRFEWKQWSLIKKRPAEAGQVVEEKCVFPFNEDPHSVWNGFMRETDQTNMIIFAIANIANANIIITQKKLRQNALKVAVLTNAQFKL